RKQGLVTRVRDQGTCASCWAFATVGAFESAWMKNQSAKPAEVDLSEQQVVDCSGAGSCGGGWYAFNYLKQHGIGDEKAYPYQGHDARPEANSPGEFRAAAWGFVAGMPLIGAPPVPMMKQALVAHGPLAVAVRTNELFMAYTGGVFDDNDPGPSNHAL